MDFFEHQDLARRNSRKLVFLFILALLGVVVSVYLLMAVAVTGYNGQIAGPDRGIDLVALLTNWQILALVGGGTLLLVGGACAYRISALSGGGQVVASSLGGRPLNHDTRDRDERRILNVVEEMAIASGIPVPPVYLLEEKGINAFAAGYSPQDAVIGVTRGCVQTLTRDELQGVIAHEYSHILNGDMRMNIRLIGFVYGIMVIGLLGWQIFRIALYTGGRRRSKDSNPIPLIAVGGGLIVIGAIGTFFGNWIKSSISRQREYLADASAVQFTRNPEGISGALKQIGGSTDHGILEHGSAPEFSHMFFATGVTGMLSSMFTTHPPLQQRIRRIEPRWNGKFPKARQPRVGEGRPKQSLKERSVARREKMAQAVTIMAGMEVIGRPTPQHVARAAKLISEIPDTLKNAARDPYGARAVLYGLLLNEEADARQRQIDQLKQHAERGLAELTEVMSRQIAALETHHRLPLVDMTLGSLKALSPTQHHNFKVNLDVLVKADSKIELFEWMLLRIVDHHLGQPQRARPQHAGLGRLQSQCSTLLSALAWVGHSDPGQVSQAFDAGAAVINIQGQKLLSREEIHFKNLGTALDVLNTVEMSKKKILLKACAHTIVADQEVTPNEAELMRAIAETFGCPMPPFLPGQTLV